MKKRIIISISIIAITIAAFIGYLSYARYYPSTDDSYVQANISVISAQVSGTVETVKVKDLAMVHTGDTLFTLDDSAFQIAVNDAQAALQRTRETIQTKQDIIKVAKANVVRNQAWLTYARKHTERTRLLVKKGELSAAEGDQAERNLQSAQASVAAAKSQLAKAIEDIGKTGEDNASIQQAKAKLAKAQLDLSYTIIKAPASGQVVNMTLRKGDNVTASTPLFALIEQDEWWVQANFKETDLTRIRPGQTATIHVDIYPHHTFHGVVEQLSQGSGAAFSLLPPENATGNWVKVTQRFPVRVRIIDPDPNYPLRVGASSTVKIDTKTTHQD